MIQISESVYGRAVSVLEEMLETMEDADREYDGVNPYPSPLSEFYMGIVYVRDLLNQDDEGWERLRERERENKLDCKEAVQ